MARYVNIPEYIRLRLDQDRRKNPLARPISARTINAAILSKKVESHEDVGGMVLIDWELYKDYEFRTHMQVPVRPKKN